MEALSNIQETERILQLLEDETSLLKEKVGEKEGELSEFAETVEARNREALVLIKGLEEQVESLNHENLELKELLSKEDEENSFLKNENAELVNKEAKLRGQLQQAVERKVDEMGKEFRKSFEANIRIMKQRIRVAEQLHTENKENFRRMKGKCEAEHSGLGDSRMVAASKRMISDWFNEALAGLESSFDGFGADFLCRTSRVADEIIVVKEWVKEKREVRKVEEEINKIDELQRRVKELEKSSMEKEEAIFDLVEQKKEVIRQMSISIEYHQNRCYELKLKATP